MIRTRIEAEDFLADANGITYYDSSSGNTGGALSRTDVDLQASSEGGHNVGWIQQGEWLTYEVTVPKDGIYALSARIASESADGQFQASIAGQESTFSFQPTGGWQKWITETGDTTFNLSAGTHVLRIDMHSSNFNLNWLELEKVDQPEDSNTTPAPLSDLDLSEYNLVWHDEFDGTAGDRPADHWFFFDGWGQGTWRDTTYTADDAYLDGDGHLTIRARVEDGTFKTSYLQTYDLSAPQSEWTTFGPGNGKYIEASVQLNQMVAGGPWLAFWLFDPTDTYDGDPTTGTEIDIFEYPISAGQDSSWTKWLPDGTYNHYMVSNHWGESENSYINADEFGVNLRDGNYHTFGVEWTAEQLTYYMDGIEVWSTTNGISTSTQQAIQLSIEYDEGPGNAWGLNDVITDYLDILPDYFLIDYVRVYEKSNPDQPGDNPPQDKPTSPDDSGEQPGGKDGPNDAVPVIFDTDFSHDVDDAGALAVLNRLQQLGEAEILAIGSASWDRDAVAGIDVINEYYGNGDIPIGRYFAGMNGSGSGGYAEMLADQFGHDQTSADAPTATALYRQTLAGQADNSVTFVTVGTLQNLNDLLNSGPDQYSALSGAELFNQKVASVHIMGGQYPQTKWGAEWNFAGSGNGVASDVVDAITKPIIFNGFEIGHKDAGYGAGDNLNFASADNPVAAAYHFFFDNPPDWVNGGVPSDDILDWSSWDPITVLTAVRGSGGYFDEVSTGTNDIADNGWNTWNSGADANHTYLTTEMDPQTFASTILEPLLL